MKNIKEKIKNEIGEEDLLQWGKITRDIFYSISMLEDSTVRLKIFRYQNQHLVHILYYSSFFYSVKSAENYVGILKLEGKENPKMF